MQIMKACVMVAFVLGGTACGGYDPTASTQSIELVKVSGGGKDLTIITGTERFDSLVVKVVDEHGRPVSGVGVTWTENDPQGALSANTSTTDPQGVAWTRWSVSGIPGSHEARASLETGTLVSFDFTVRSATVKALAVAESQQHRCMITQEDVLACAGTPFERPRPVLVGERFRALARGHAINASRQALCALAVDGGVWCAPTAAPALVFSRVPTIPPVRSLAGGGLQGTYCGITQSNELWCWGGADYGVRADGIASGFSTTPQLAANHPPGIVGGLAMATEWGCVVVADGRPWCWGSNRSGMINPDQDKGTLHLPTRIETGHALTALALAKLDNSACGLRQDGRTVCWGESWQVGRADPQPWRHVTPDLAASTIPLQSITAFEDGYLGIGRDDFLYAWGAFGFNYDGGTKGPMVRAAATGDLKVRRVFYDFGRTRVCVDLAGGSGTVCDESASGWWSGRKASWWRGIPPIVPIDSL